MAEGPYGGVRRARACFVIASKSEAPQSSAGDPDWFAVLAMTAVGNR